MKSKASSSSLDLKSKEVQKSAKWPSNPSAVKQLKNQIEFEQIGELDIKLFPWPFMICRYLVTYMNSQTLNRIRSTTVVTVTNQSNRANRVGVYFYRGLVGTGGSPVGSCFYTIPPGATIDFATRRLPNEITTVNCVPTPELTYAEGRAIVCSQYAGIAVSSRVIYTEGDKDTQLLAISDSNIVDYGQGNEGD